MTVIDAHTSLRKEECALSMGQSSNDDKRRGVCRRHGAYRNTYDESTAFGSEFDKTTATLTVANHQRTYSSSSTTRGGRRSSVPGEVTILCQEIVVV
jgi:hypothetical protein